MSDDNVVQLPPPGRGRMYGRKIIDVPDFMPMDIDNGQLWLTEAKGILDMLSNNLKGMEESVALTAHRLVCDAYRALFGTTACAARMRRTSHEPGRDAPHTFWCFDP